jgi:hypothetical protein
MQAPPTKPRTLNADLLELPPALAPLVSQGRWVVWRWEYLADKDKWTKVPYQPACSAARARSNDPTTWADYQTAVTVADRGEADGIGFMLKDSNIAAFDIDDCRDVETGGIAPWAMELVEEADSYAEVTVSGTGLRIVGFATGPHVHRNQPYRQTGSRIETYRRATRYIVVTGNCLLSSADRLANVDGIVDRVVAELDQRDKGGCANVEPNGGNGHHTPTAMAPLPEQLAEVIRHGAPRGKRSEQFHHVIGWCKELGYSINQIEELLAAHPCGIAAKFLMRLRQEIERSFYKAGRDDAGSRTDGSRSSDQPIPMHWHGDSDSFLDRRWLIRDLVPEVGKGLLPGQWGTGKTFVALDQSASVMTGQPFAGHEVDRRGGVLFVAPEGAYEIPIRLQGIVEGKLRRAALAQSLPDDDVRLNLERLPIAWTDECPRLLDGGAVKKLVATANVAAEHLRQRFGLPLALIIIDTVAAAAGFNDENAAAENQKVMNALERLSYGTGAFVIGVDHFGKMVETGTRGSSAKEAAADVVLAALADRDVAGNIANTRMAVRKVRGGRAGFEVPYALEVIEVDRDKQDRPITTCIVNWQPPQSASTTTKPQTRWPASLRIFKRAMEAAVIEQGETLRPFGSEGPEVKAVLEPAVRAEFAATYPAEGDTKDKKADAKRKAYSRALKDALARQLVCAREISGVDYLWFAQDTAETGHPQADGQGHL